MSSPLHPLAADYLQRLRREARRLPREIRRELLADIESHLAEASRPEMRDGEVLSSLDRLGDPQEIVAAHTHGPGPGAARGVHEWSAIILLLVGGFFMGIGWIVGLILLWSSNAWRTLDKWIGTLVLPGGLAGAVFFVLASSGTASECHGPQAISIDGKPLAHPAPPAVICSGGPSTISQILTIALLIVAILAPILTAIYLARQAGKEALVVA